MVPPLKDTQPAPVDTGPALETAQPPAVNNTPPSAAAGAGLPASRLFPHVDLTNLRVDAAHNERFHSHTGDQRLLPGGRRDKDGPPSDGDRRAQGLQHSHFQNAPTRSSPANPYHPSRPRVQDTRPRDIWVEVNDQLGGSFPFPKIIDRRRQAATARVSQFDIAALVNVKYHEGSDGYDPLTPVTIHKCGYTAINRMMLSAVTTRSFWFTSP